jgi:hypothetical protein
MQFDQLHRRKLITLLDRAAAAWPLAAPTQQSDHLLLGGHQWYNRTKEMP